MPRIKDATGLKLSTIVTELRLDYLRDKREVRSRSSGLYLKEGEGKYASSISRKLHREKAIGLVRDSLAAEHNITTDDE